jgi:sarcosine oxidase
MRQVPLWFGTRDDRLFRRDVFPVYITETPGGCFYGVPVIDRHGHKCARHYGAPELSGPKAVHHAAALADELPVRAFLARHLPDANGERRHASVCIYTLTPDRHFLIDRHPDHPQVAVAAGFSGHGFKFAPVVGEILADLAEHGRTDRPIGLFRFDRFGR